MGLEWDMNSDTISIAMSNSSSVFLWSVFTKQDLIEISVGDASEQVSFQKWSPTHPVLVIGTKKGGLVFYNKKTKKKLPTVFKHSEEVTDGDWNSEGNLSKLSLTELVWPKTNR